MERFTGSIEKAIADKNWFCTLFLSLALPDICSRIESENNRTNGMKYAAWWNSYCGDQYYFRADEPMMTGDDCYVLRCSMLHEGVGDVSHQKRKGTLERFHFTSNPLHLNQLGNIMLLNVEQFSKDIILGVSRWKEFLIQNDPEKLNKLSDLLEVHEGEFQIGIYHCGL
jgi:hypothetical protein